MYEIKINKFDIYIFMYVYISVWILWITTHGYDQHMVLQTETLTDPNQAQARAGTQSSIPQGSSLQIPAIAMCTMVKKPGCTVQPSHPLPGSLYLV